MVLKLIKTLYVYVTDCCCDSWASGVTRTTHTPPCCTVQSAHRTCARSVARVHTPHVRWRSTGACHCLRSPVSGPAAPPTPPTQQSLSASRTSVSPRPPSCASSAKTTDDTRTTRYESFLH